MCVCNIWTDVKLLIEFTLFAGEWSRPAELHLTKLSAVSWGYHWRRPVTYLRCCDHRLFRVCFHSIVHVCWWEEAQPKNLNVNLFISSRLPQSVFSPKPCHGLAASEPSSEQGRRKYTWNNLFTWSPTSSSPTVIYLLAKLRRDIADDIIAGLFIPFDVDSEPDDHSEVLLLFVGCIVNFIVSYLTCMFQDSVPAGSYNDPFLSSVCVCLFCFVLLLLFRLL